MIDLKNVIENFNSNLDNAEELSNMKVDRLKLANQLNKQNKRLENTKENMKDQ